MVNILALDPGSVNFAWSIITYRPDGKYKITAAGMIQNVINDLKIGMLPKGWLFHAEMEALVKRFNIQEIVVERFMSRGSFGGGGMEAICLELGIVLMVAEKEFMMLTSASWKNAFNRLWPKKEYTLKDYYKERERGTPLHPIDASLMGIYYVEKFKLDVTPFQGFETKKRRDRIMGQICTHLA